MSSTPAQMSAVDTDPILIFAYDDGMNRYNFYGLCDSEADAVKKCEEIGSHTYCPFFALYGNLSRQHELLGQKVDSYSLRRVVANVKRWRGQGASPMHTVIDTKKDNPYTRFYFQ